jgi:hypothetical protein
MATEASRPGWHRRKVRDPGVGQSRGEKSPLPPFRKGGKDCGFLKVPLFIPMSSQTTIFVILSAAKNLSVEAAEILHSATLRSE